MSEWKCYKLSEISSLSNGINFDKSAYTRGVKLIGVSDFKNRIHPDYDSLQEVDSKVVKSGDYLEKGDIVFVRSNGNKELVGRCMMIDQDIPVTYSGFCIKLRLIDKNYFEPVFFNYLFRTRQFRNAMTGTAVGANIQNLSQSRLGNCEVCVPCIEEQREIASILSRYDSLIENYQKQIKLLEEAAQRLYKEWFVDLHFHGHENTKIVDGVPEGWEKKRLGDITRKFATGLNPRKNFVLGHGNNYYVTIKNMANNNVVFDEKCDKVDDEALEKINKRSDLQQGDLLFSGIGTIGRVYLIDKPVRNWNISESVFTMRPNTDIPSTFLYLVLLDKEIQDYCQSNAHGCAQKGIRMADLKAFEVLVPSEEILNSFGKVSSNLIKQVKNKTSQIHLLAEARDRLLPKLMSGEKLIYE